MPSLRKCAVLAAAFAALAVANTAWAQDTGNGFLFGRPTGSFTLRGGWAGASAHSDLFAFTTDALTINRGAFSSPTIGADLAFRLFGRTQLVMSAELSGVDRRSEFRHFIDNDNLPIEQVTTYRRAPFTVSVKHYLTSPGRAIGNFAWIPSRAAAFVGAGGGGEYYVFRQNGDFIDFKTLDVFHNIYTSDGWASTAHAFAGADYSLTAQYAITTEARYSWAKAPLSHDFSGFQRLDLSGFSTTVGFTVRF